jgi:hypothetical protein
MPLLTDAGLRTRQMTAYPPACGDWLLARHAPQQRLFVRAFSAVIDAQVVHATAANNFNLQSPNAPPTQSEGPFLKLNQVHDRLKGVA